MKKHKHFVKIGTSGYHYQHWNDVFYPSAVKADEQLNYYSQQLDTVEINNTFYRMPAIHTVNEWKENTPDDFLFSVKGSRYITHVKKLHVTKAVIIRLIKRISHFESKLGPILFQLPPNWKCDTDRFEAFLKRLPEDYRYAFEFRNSDWYNEDVYKLLRQFNCAFCIYQLAGHESPLIVTADFVYVRLHGPGKNKYQGSYTDAQLKVWAKQCASWRRSGKDVYLYFDNDQKAYAAFNAVQIKRLLK